MRTVKMGITKAFLKEELMRLQVRRTGHVLLDSERDSLDGSILTIKKLLQQVDK